MVFGNTWLAMVCEEDAFCFIVVLNMLVQSAVVRRLYSLIIFVSL